MLEIDFILSERGHLLSGHDPDTYVKFGHPLTWDIRKPAEVTNGHGGRCTTLQRVLRRMSSGSVLFADLKDTLWHPDLSQKAVEAATKAAIEASAAVVLMVYDVNAHALDAGTEGVVTCIKLEDETRCSYENLLDALDLARHYGATYVCAPSTTAFPDYAAVCRSADVTLVVPIDGRKSPEELAQHIRAGVTHFICGKRTVLSR